MICKTTARRAGAALTTFVTLGAIPAALAQNPAISLEAPTVEVVGTTPLPGIGAPREEIPANVQSFTGQQMQERKALNLPDFLEQAAGSVTVNSTQGSTFQPEVNYRGFNSSHLIGVPQGLSVYQDGVRINEPFGDVVNWDLIPQMAVSTVNLIPGSNPLFGLNTLGGALSIRTKSGARYPDTSVEAFGGAWGRYQIQAEQGGYGERFDYYVAGNWFEENGWRDHSPSKVKQFFGKVGFESGGTDLDLSVTWADSDLIGNELTPQSFYDASNTSIFTRPDQTQNRMTMVNLTGSHWFSDTWLLSGNLYLRNSKRDGNNGDTNDEFEGGPNDGETGANGGLGINAETAAINRLAIDQKGSGAGLQLSYQAKSNRLTLGTTWDQSDSSFSQFEQEGVFDSTRAAVATGPEQIENSLDGKIDAWSLFVTDTWSITGATHLTLSARYNQIHIKNQDLLSPVALPNLNADYTYRKVNPAVGITHTFSPAATVYAGWAQGNRAPTPIELGCADPANPCTLPNAMASDPFLEQVVARTTEVGFSGNLGRKLGYNVALFHTENRDDIIFISTSAAAGYFTNFGKTRRQGLEAGLHGEAGRLAWSANYSYIDATFQSSACLLSEGNSSRGTSACAADDEIFVSAGDRIPGIPQNALKLNADYRFNDQFTAGITVNAFSSQHVRGNENNQHQPGTYTDNFGNTRTFLGPGEAGGYAIVNLRASWRPSPGWEVFGRIDNMFNKSYFNGGALAENPFNAAGSFQTNSDDWTRETFYAPGAPRAAWVGVRFDLERKPRK